MTAKDHHKKHGYNSEHSDIEFDIGNLNITLILDYNCLGKWIFYWEDYVGQTILDNNISFYKTETAIKYAKKEIKKYIKTLTNSELTQRR